MTPVLYIIMRNDLESMNCGKAIAQGSHASNAFVHEFHAYMQEVNGRSKNRDMKKIEDLNHAFTTWETETGQGFGTVLVLEGKYPEIKNSVDTMFKLGYISGMVFDPTYPILDGQSVHHIPLETCGFVFVPDKDTDINAKAFLGEYKLHK